MQKIIFPTSILTCSFAQGQSTNEYMDKGPVESIQSFCQQGLFSKKTGELKRMYYHSFGVCDDSSLERFDTDGNLIYWEFTYANSLYNGVPVDRRTVIHMYTYEAGVEIKRDLIQLDKLGDTLSHTTSYNYETAPGFSVDSVFNHDGTFDAWSQNEFNEELNADISSYHSADDSFKSIDSMFWNEQDQVIKTYSFMGGDGFSDETIRYYKHDPNEMRSYTLDGSDTMNYNYDKYNDSGLVIVHSYRPVKKSMDDYHRYTYSYTYDSYGNWYKKFIYENEKLIAIEERKIVYRRQE